MSATDARDVAREAFFSALRLAVDDVIALRHAVDSNSRRLVIAAQHSQAVAGEALQVYANAVRLHWTATEPELDLSPLTSHPVAKALIRPRDLPSTDASTISKMQSRLDQLRSVAEVCALDPPESIRSEWIDGPRQRIRSWPG